MVSSNSKGSRPWRDPGHLKRLYWDEGLTLDEVSDELGCSRPTVIKWMDRHGIDRRGAGGVDPAVPYRDKNVLRELYVEEGMTTYEVADKLGTDEATIRYWMDFFELERRPKYHHILANPAYFRTGSTGYERWEMQYDGERHVVKVHRLAAVAWFGFDAVVGMDVHHKNGVKWDTREDNLELLSHADHARHHANESRFWEHRENYRG